MKYVVLMVLMTFSVLAEKEPFNGRLDKRVKQIDYTPNQVYKVTTHYFLDTMIVFSANEEIIYKSAGDKAAWNITSVQNYLSLKPIDDRADTNLNVLTQDKVTSEIKEYVFELRVSKDRGINDNAATFMLKFNYPMAAKKLEMLKLAKAAQIEQTEVVKGNKKSIEHWNMDYSYSGDSSYIPNQVLDDGEFTYFRFNPDLELPAIFLVDEDGEESLINYHIQGKYVVVQRLGKQFTLRNGNKVSCVFNENPDYLKNDSTMKKAAPRKDDGQ